MTRLTSRSSTIFVATAEGTRTFRAVEEVPLPLRKKLQDSMQGNNSATILIADKRGREELVRALRGHKLNSERAFGSDLVAGETRGSRVAVGFRTWVKLLLPLALGASLWLLLGTRF